MPLLTLTLLEDSADGSVGGVDGDVERSLGQRVVQQGGGGQGFLAGFEGFVGRGRPLDFGVSAGPVRCDQGVKGLEELGTLGNESPVEVEHPQEFSKLFLRGRLGELPYGGNLLLR